MSGQSKGRLVAGLWEALGEPVGHDLRGAPGDHPGQSGGQPRAGGRQAHEETAATGSPSDLSKIVEGVQGVSARNYVERRYPTTLPTKGAHHATD